MVSVNALNKLINTLTGPFNSMFHCFSVFFLQHTLLLAVCSFTLPSAWIIILYILHPSHTAWDSQFIMLQSLWHHFFLSPRKPLRGGSEKDIFLFTVQHTYSLQCPLAFIHYRNETAHMTCSETR